MLQGLFPWFIRWWQRVFWQRIILFQHSPWRGTAVAGKRWLPNTREREEAFHFFFRTGFHYFYELLPFIIFPIKITQFAWNSIFFQKISIGLWRRKGVESLVWRNEGNYGTDDDNRRLRRSVFPLCSAQNHNSSNPLSWSIQSDSKMHSLHLQRML